jgi:dihydroorotate dehydrogenase (fumarate)
MDLTTKYLGLKLRSPLVPAASPLSIDIDNLKRKWKMPGAGAVVLESLFEEQLRAGPGGTGERLEQGTESLPKP